MNQPPSDSAEAQAIHVSFDKTEAEVKEVSWHKGMRALIVKVAAVLAAVFAAALLWAAYTSSRGAMIVAGMFIGASVVVFVFISQAAAITWKGLTPEQRHIALQISDSGITYETSGSTHIHTWSFYSSIISWREFYIFYAKSNPRSASLWIPKRAFESDAVEASFSKLIGQHMPAPSTILSTE
jgi:hypothetical protein